MANRYAALSTRWAGPRRNQKFGNKPTFYDSPTLGPKTFDSKWEAQLCQMLDVMKQAGEIRTFFDQVTIPLPALSVGGRRRAMRVDFGIIGNDGRLHLWDAKGRTTAKWELQRDIVWQHHGLDVIPVKNRQALPPLEE